MADTSGEANGKANDPEQIPPKPPENKKPWKEILFYGALILLFLSALGLFMYGHIKEDTRLSEYDHKTEELASTLPKGDANACETFRYLISKDQLDMQNEKDQEASKEYFARLEILLSLFTGLLAGRFSNER